MYAQLLICASLLVAAYQDVRERSVLDLVWIPAAVGAALVLVLEYPALELPLAKLLLLGGAALAFALLGLVGQADAIALVVVAADPFPISPIPALVATAVVALAHIGYEIAVGNARGTKTIPLERFAAEQKWIPKAFINDGKRTEVSKDVNVARDQVKGGSGTIVEVTYGVPTVAYIGVGYLLFLLYLLAFNPSAFFALP